MADGPDVTGRMEQARETMQWDRGERRGRRSAVGRRAWTLLLLGVSACMLGGSPASAQTVRGNLLAFGSDEPIDVALIIMVSESGDSVASTLTAANGYFELTAPAPGNYLLEASAFGYRDTRVGLFELGSGGEITVEFRLWPRPLEIDGVMVESLVQRNPELVRNGFYRRMQRGVGTFLTPERIEQETALRTIDMLTTLAGVRYTIDAQGRERLLVRGTSGYCVPTVFVDGVRTEWANVDMALETIVPKEALYAAEVHRGAAAMPMEFGSFNSCGVLVFWTIRNRR